MKLFKSKMIFGCEARGDHYSLYLQRWEFFSSDRFAIYLHKFHRSDDNESLHDHPWDFITIPLWRGYNDCTFAGGTKEKPHFNKQRIKPFQITYRPASHIHYVELIDNKPAWTLVIRFKYKRWWGFWNDGIFTRFDKYFEKMGC